MLLAHSLTHNKPLWGVGANRCVLHTLSHASRFTVMSVVSLVRAAVRCIGGSADKLVATGDDGCALIFGF